MNELPSQVAFVFLTLRGFLLWLVIPYGFVAWLVYYRWVRSASLGQCLGWFDINLMVFLQRVLLKRFIPNPTAIWVPSNKMSTVRHRFRPWDVL